MHYVLTSRSWMFSKTKASVRRGGIEVLMKDVWKTFNLWWCAWKIFTKRSNTFTQHTHTGVQSKIYDVALKCQGKDCYWERSRSEERNNDDDDDDSIDDYHYNFIIVYDQLFVGRPWLDASCSGVGLSGGASHDRQMIKWSNHIRKWSDDQIAWSADDQITWSADDRQMIKWSNHIRKGSDGQMIKK